MPTTRAAVIQLNPGADKAKNLDTAERFIREAAAQGAQLIALPEYFALYGTAVSPTSMQAIYGSQAESIPGPTTDRLRALARELSVQIVGGSIFEREGDQIFNTATAIDETGEIVAVYRKTHLFEARAPELTYHEGSAITPGTELVTTQLTIGGQATEIGMSICYDVRFPEVYRALVSRGASVLLIPAAFPHETGRDHWEVLLRARAIENQAYVIAPAQWGPQSDGSMCHGRSLIVDPKGTVLVTVPDGEGIGLATLDLARVLDYRKHYPNIENRRPELYGSAAPIAEGQLTHA